MILTVNFTIVIIAQLFTPAITQPPLNQFIARTHTNSLSAAVSDFGWFLWLKQMQVYRVRFVQFGLAWLGLVIYENKKIDTFFNSRLIKVFCYRTLLNCKVLSFSRQCDTSSGYHLPVLQYAIEKTAYTLCVKTIAKSVCVLQNTKCWSEHFVVNANGKVGNGFIEM